MQIYRRPSIFERTQVGFTIVELLVVIVIIGILAALVVVAYNGIQSRSINATMQSELSNIGRELGVTEIDSGQLPTVLTTLNKGRGYNTSNGIAYQYTYNNNVSPKTFCVSVTSTKVTETYYLENGGRLQPGLCPGHVAANAGPAYTFQNLTWAAATRPVPRSIVGLATTTDGATVVAADNNGNTTGYLYVSTNRGTTWSSMTAAGLRRWTSIDVSGDGQRMVASAWGGGVYTSVDAGANWSVTSLPTANWNVVAVSQDGLVMAAGAELGSLYTSTDGGATWPGAAAGTSNRRWSSLALSANGQIMHAASQCTSNSDMATTTNAGASWTIRTLTPMCNNDVTTSGSGQLFLTAMASNGTWLYSTDAGAAWSDWAGRISTSSSTNRVTDVDMSSDGTKIIAARAVSSVKFSYISKDSGVTWTTYSTDTGGSLALDSPGLVEVSYDGATLYTSTYNGFFVGRFD
jgi:prepilin-type N-terminal cleavage/methylation domain-containing protein